MNTQIKKLAFRNQVPRTQGPAKAGSLLRSARKSCNLRNKDVHAATRRIAKVLGPEFAVPISCLENIESGLTVPSRFRLSSLCAVYRLNMPEVLKWYAGQNPPVMSRSAAA